MTAPERAEIVCASDAAYWPALAAMIWSLRCNGGDPAACRVWVLDGGLPRGGVERLRTAVAPLELEFLRPCRDGLRGLPVGDHYSEVAYFRLLIPELLPEGVSRVLYLDADTIVTAPLTELFATSFGGNPILAARCSVIREMSHPKALGNYRELGYPPDHPYFNSGVLLMDLDRFRRERLGAAVLDYVRHNAGAVRWVDQDGLNATLGRRWGQLPRRWNHLIDPWAAVSDESREAAAKVLSCSPDRPAVLHFLSGWKPWHADYPHPAGEVFRIYWDATAAIREEAED